MKKLREFTKYAAISPEMAILLLIVVFISLEPIWLKKFSLQLFKNKEGLKYLAMIPAATIIWCAAKSSSILFPNDDTSSTMQKWPNFWKLKLRLYIGLAFQLLFALVALYAWLSFEDIDNVRKATFLLGSVTGSVISAATFFFASISAVEIIRRSNAD